MESQRLTLIPRCPPCSLPWGEPPASSTQPWMPESFGQIISRPLALGIEPRSLGRLGKHSKLSSIPSLARSSLIIPPSWLAPSCWVSWLFHSHRLQYFNPINSVPASVFLSSLSLEYQEEKTSPRAIDSQGTHNVAISFLIKIFMTSLEYRTN